MSAPNTPPRDAFNLCCMCGTISRDRDWTYWQRDDEGENWRPSLPGEGDPMALCPACKWEHQDTDDGSGFYQGTLEQMEVQREADLLEMGEWWAETLARAVVSVGGQGDARDLTLPPESAKVPPVEAELELEVAAPPEGSAV